MRTLKATICSALVPAVVSAALLLPRPGLAVEDVSYSIEQAWFRPTLTVNNDPELCGALLDGYTRYFSRTGDINPLVADFRGERFRADYSGKPLGTDSLSIVGKALKEVEWKPVQSYVAEYSGDFSIAEKQLNGELFAIVRWYHWVGSGEVFDDVLRTGPFPGVELPVKVDEIHQLFWKHSFSRLAFNDKTKIYDVIYPNDLKRENSESEIRPELFNVYSAKDGIYLLLNSLYPQPGTYILVRVVEPKKLALTCSLQTVPQQAQIDERLQELPGFKALSDDLLAMMGFEGDCGTLRALVRARNGLADFLTEMLYRPWGFPAGDWEQVRRQRAVDSSLFDWGHSGIWNYHVYRRYETHRLEAEKQLARFYRRQFGLDEQTAKGLVDNVLAHALVSGFDHGSATDNMTNLHVKLLTGESVDMFSGEEISSATDEPAQDSLLTFAIGHPELVRFLLGKGLDPDHQNAFGKTPLMYAAQYDEVESAKILLEHGAMVEAATIESGDTCNYTIGVKNVSPLHYAVRYASKQFVELLLEHAAPTYVKDSKGKTPYDYLQMYVRDCGGDVPDPDGKPPEWNAHLSSGDCAALQATLRPPDESEIGRLSTKANLQAERLYREGKLKEAYAALKRAISLDPGNERARANQSLVALKLGRLGESAQLSTALIASATSDAEKANAYFNLGLACRQEELSGSYYPDIQYDGARYCENDVYAPKGKRINRSAFVSFLAAYRLQPTPDRLAAVLRYLEQSDPANDERLLKFSDSDNGVRSLYFSGSEWYFLVDADKEVPFKKLEILVNNKMEEFVFTDKEVVPLSTTLKLEHWSKPSPYYGNWVFPLNLDSMIYVLNSSFVFPSDTRVVQINSSRIPVTEKPRIVVNKGLPTPTLLLLYGNGVDWAIEGDLNNIKGVYIHGYSSFYQPVSRRIPVYADNEKASYSSKDKSMHEVETLSKLGLPVSFIITVDESGKAVVGE